MFEKFAIYGIRIEFEYFMDKLNETDIFGDDIGFFYEGCQRFHTSMVDELKEYLEIEDDLEIYICESSFLVFNEKTEEITEVDGLELFAGKSWSEIGDNQTGLQFKEEVKNMINEHFYFIDDYFLHFDTELNEYLL